MKQDVSDRVLIFAVVLNLGFMFINLHEGSVGLAYVNINVAALSAALYR